MKSEPFAGRFTMDAKTAGWQLNRFAAALAGNGNATPEGWEQVADTLARDLARAWGKGDWRTFADLAELLQRTKDTGTPPGEWEYPAEQIAAVVLSRPFKLPDGGTIEGGASNLGATPEDVVAEALRRGIKGVSLVVARRALVAVAARYGLRMKRGRRKGAKTSAEKKRLAKLRKGREGKGDSGLAEM